MYKAVEVLPGQGTWWVGVNDRETDLFEGLWTLPRGVAYNAYLLVGAKTAAIDTVKGGGEYEAKLREVLGDRPLDYLVVNHMEPDHAGVVRRLRRLYPSLTLIGNAKTVPMLKGYHGIEDGVVEVKDGEKLDIGGHVLSFHTIPMVHWPESMVTFDETTGTLFSNDAFGGYGAHEGGLFDDERPRERWEGEMLRYYATIVARYSGSVQAALRKLGGLSIKHIYPAHGTLFRKDPGLVVSLYDRWSKQDADGGAVVVYGSMYGHTRRMAEAVCRGLSTGPHRVSDVRLHDASRSDRSQVLADIWASRGLVLLSCTYNTALYPPMASLCEKLANSMLKRRVLGLAGSYSWSGGALAALKKFADAVKLDAVAPEVEVFAAPTDADLERCADLGSSVADGISEFKG
ncbi:MAG: FprA family A-type flavoprotein [Synergistaceae bacterium]|jgi:flavorubredoxin|nr:FprA family A-type flavoprotein [Synergistaceae bacterium]